MKTLYNLKINIEMTRLLKTVPLALLAAACTGTSASAAIADSFKVPASDANGVKGATMPYTRYDCNAENEASLGGGASIKRSLDWAAGNKATQASNQAYVDMPVGSTVAWKVSTAGDGVTVRYTIADKHVGGIGQDGGYATKEGTLEFYVNGTKAGEVDLTSYYMYQYFSFGSGSPSQSGGDACNFCFDEKHIQLSRMLKAGDELMVKCTDGSEVGVDFVELEVVPEPLDPADDSNGRQIFNVTQYGAKANDAKFDNRSAFTSAFNAASRVGGIVFVPEGTWYMGHDGQGGHGILSLAGKNVKVMGAGIWHTNIQFTGWKMFGGGISGGNPSNTGGSNEMDNIEWCHMYVNSNLSDRLGENAVYKGFMDIWCGGSAIHDVWEEHFETGLWFGDYNSAQRRASDGVVIYNCRIRDNYADGVNFCQGTSNAAVWNCSVRNNGDDGLACWNNTENIKDETSNTFAYNTIDFIWRAGAVAIYGGKDQKVYNNYIADTFMSSGVHMNTTFPGPGFASASASEPILVENNVMVRAGTPAECWGRDYAAIDIEGEVKHCVFRNNYIYDCPAEIVRLKGGNLEGIVFDGLYCNGAGLSKQVVNYSASNHSVGAGNIESNNGVSWNNFQIVRGSVPAATVGAELGEYAMWPFWSHEPTNWSWVDSPDWEDTPPYPDATHIEPVENAFDTLRDYDVTLTGIDWITGQGKHSMYDEDQVALRVRIDNKGRNSIPAETAKFKVRFTIDGADSYSVTIKDGLAAGASKIIEFPTKWNATKGQHTFLAQVDPDGKMTYESDRNNNSRTKEVNVMETPEGEEPEIVIPTHSGPDMGVLKVYFENLTGSQDEIKVGDRLMPHAIVANCGSQTITLGSGKGVLWGIGGSPEYNSGMLWDDATHVLNPGEYIDVTPNGGGNQATGGWNSDNTYTVKAGDVDLWCRMDTPTAYNDNNADNNALNQIFTYPKSKPVYNDNPDRADNLENGGYWDYEDGESGGGDPEVTGFDLVASMVFWSPGDKEIFTGDEIGSFRVRVANNSGVALPAGKTVRVTLSIDGSSIGTVTASEGIAANGYVDLALPGSYEATPGGHVVKAIVNNVSGELSFDNNSRERTFNAIGGVSVIEPDSEYVTGFSEAQVQGRSLVIRSISWGKTARDAEGIRPGDQLKFSAVVVNNGTEATPAQKHGLLLESLDFGGYDPKYWSDDFRQSIQPGQTVTLTTCGGTDDNKGIWSAVKGISNFRVMLDDQNELGLKGREGATVINSLPVEIAETPAEVEMHDSPTGADIEMPTGVESFGDEEDGRDTWFTIEGIRVEAPSAPGIYIRNGKKVMVK